MMRIRSTKPEFWRSERIASVSWEDRLVLKGLESYVDDNGVGKDDLALIVADVFPRDLSRNPPGTLQKVSEAISNLSSAGLLWRYSNKGTNLLYISFWESAQRIDKPSKGRFPRPDGTFDYRDSEIRESLPEPSRNTPGTLPPGTGEQGNRGTGKNTPSSTDVDAEFEAWWKHYPRKVDKGHARKAYKTARRKTDSETLTTAVQAFSQSVNGADPKFVAHAATWLNGERWNDAPEREPYDPYDMDQPVPDYDEGA